MSDYGRIGSADPATRPPAQAPAGLGDTASVRCAGDFTIADVLAWARTKRADDSYDFDDIENCALCQFLRETNRACTPIVGNSTWSDGWNGNHQIPRKADQVAGTAPYTFGALVARLEKLCPKPSEWTHPDAYMNDVVVL